jgi:hypothetical protein
MTLFMTFVGDGLRLFSADSLLTHYFKLFSPNNIIYSIKHYFARPFTRSIGNGQATFG